MSLKQKIKDWWKEVVEICKRIFCHFLSKWGGVKCEEYRTSTILFAVFLMSFVVAGGIGSGFKFLPSITASLVDNLVQTPLSPQGEKKSSSLASSRAPLLRQPDDIVSKEAGDCFLQNGDWDLWLGKLSTDVEDKTHFFLPQDSDRALLKYEGEIKDISACEFVFVPRGNQSINYVISFDGVYQIVIGDNDYWTVSLRASDRVNGPLYPVKETRIGKTRPRLLSAIKQGSLVRVLMEQSFNRNSSRYLVKATIRYEPEVAGATETVSEEFSWAFTPSPAVDLYSPTISIGLIRGQGDNSEIGVSFLWPNPNSSAISGR